MRPFIALHCSSTCCLFLLAATAALWPLAIGTCSPDSGPANSYACVSISRYSGSQYATCLTNTYIQVKSGGRHICSNTHATYCYYQCMLEFHSSNSGPVASDCSCNASVTPPPVTSGTTLPPSCYSPSGEDCSWYTDCLERKVACGPRTGYALAFGKKYCELYSQNYGWFTDLTRQWVDAVRKCLQVSLVPLMRDFNHPTCDQVKETAISHHTGCYLSPAKGQPSMCQVIANSCVDVLKIFFTIKGSFVENDTTVLSGTWKSFGEVGWACKMDFLVHCAPKLALLANPQLRVISLTVLLMELVNGRSRRSVESEPGQAAMELAAALSNKLAWKARGIEWIPLSADGGTETINFQLLLGDQRVFNLNRNYSQPLDLGQEVQDLQDRVRSGDLRLSLSDGRQFFARQLSDCGDSNCTVVRSAASAPAEASGAGLVQPLPWILPTLAVLVYGVCGFGRGAGY